MSEATSVNLGRALDCASDAVFVLDREWRIAYLNRSAEDLLKRPREQLIGRVAWEFFAEAIDVQAQTRFLAAADGHEPVEYEVLAPTSRRWLMVRLFPSDTDVVLYLRDVTPRKVAEDALRESEARYRSFFEHSLDGMVIATPSGEILSINPAACHLVDRTEAEIRALGRDGILDTRDPRRERMLDERARTGYARSELTVLRKDGTKIPIEVATAVFVDPHGQPRASVTLRDLTAQKRGEDRLRIIADAGALLGASLQTGDNLSALTRLVVPRMADACVVDLLDGSGLRRVAVAHRDPQWNKLLRGLGSPGPLQDRPVGFFKVARTGEAELVPIVDETYRRAAMLEGSYRALMPLAMLPKSLIFVPFRGRAGVLGVLTMCMVTGAHRYDALDLSTAQAIADRAALAIENARLFEQTVQAKRLREDVLGIVSHDLRSPLSSIGLNAQVLARKTGAREALAIARTVPRAEALINDLLTAAALDAGSLPLRKNAESLRDVVQEAIEMELPSARERSVALEATIADEIPRVTMDRHRVLEALGNLLENALKFTPPGGRVSVDAWPRDGSVAVAVSDTGPGIAADQRQHLFDRFWQGATQRSGGAGLGLSIAKGIVEAHGGSLSVDSAPGHGATFTFVLPLGQ